MTQPNRSRGKPSCAESDISLLAYYQQNRFNPVPIALRDDANWKSHFAKRCNLYERHLGIPLCLLRGSSVLEVGCGNGYVARLIVENFAVEIDAMDFSSDMIELAKQQKIESSKGRANFFREDILNFNKTDRYDLIFTERCLQNLVSWKDQKVALANIVCSLKVAGQFLMLESFWTGLNNLNNAREELDLPLIDPPWHNLFFDEEETKTYMSNLGCRFLDQNCFLSGYYFGSRVLLPALTPKGKPVTSKSILNEYFCMLRPHGDFCPMKILRFEKIAGN